MCFVLMILLAEVVSSKSMFDCLIRPVCTKRLAMIESGKSSVEQDTLLETSISTTVDMQTWVSEIKPTGHLLSNV